MQGTYNNTLLCNYKLIQQCATKSSEKGRAMNGYVIGIKNNFVSRVTVLCQNDQLCTIILDRGDIKFNITFVYISPSCQVKVNELFSHINSFSDSCIIIGDLNSRIGDYQNISLCQNHETQVRTTKDLFVNTKGKELIDFLDMSNLTILNGRCASDPLGQFTFCNNNGSSVIDMTLASHNIAELLDFEVLEAVDSSHFPIIVTIMGNNADHKQCTSVERILWNEEKVDSFKNILSNLLSFEQQPNLGMNELCETMLHAARDAGMVKKKVLGGNNIYRGPIWFDKSCLQMKRRSDSISDIFVKFHVRISIMKNADRLT